MVLCSVYCSKKCSLALDRVFQNCGAQHRQKRGISVNRPRSLTHQETYENIHQALILVLKSFIWFDCFWRPINPITFSQ